MRFVTFTTSAAGADRVGRLIDDNVHEIHGAGSLVSLLGDDGELRSVRRRWFQPSR